MRKTAEWKEIHNELLKQPFCHKRQQLVRIIMCLDYDDYCRWEGLCYPCLKVPLRRKFVGLFRPNSVAEYRVVSIFTQKTEQETVYPNIF